jgi:hypothetical protein
MAKCPSLDGRQHKVYMGKGCIARNPSPNEFSRAGNAWTL